MSGTLNKKLHNESNSAIRGGVKPLLTALFAGCIALTIPSAAFASESNAPAPILDKLHNAGTLIPDTQSVYPASEYTLVEIQPADTENLAPNVIKIYNPNTVDANVHYYEIGFKQPVYGEGTAEKYYKWAKDENGVKLVETENTADAVLTLKYNPDSAIAPIQNGIGETLAQINEIYVEQDIKNIISARGTIDNLSSIFKGNSIEVTNDDNYRYSAIISEVGGTIKNITSSFIGNNIDVVTNNKTVYGAFIKDLSNINNITSEFIANAVRTDSATVNGGMIEVAEAGVLGKLSSDFLSNSVIGETSIIEGAVLANDGKINAIDSSMFIGNYGVSGSGDVLGGVIYNGNGEITIIKDSIFEGNYISSGSGDALGGAIYNYNLIENINNSIFTDNYASSDSSQALGGAIYTDSSLKISATDGKLTEFTGNYIINNGKKENQAIYVSSDRATLTLETRGDGQILMNDIINGVEGYNVLFTGDGSGKISIYNQILNADIEALSGANIDFADGTNTNYDFLSLTAGQGATFSIDANFADGTADTLTLGEGSSGIIYIDSINILGKAPTEGSKIIQILKSPNTISIGLTDKLLQEFTSRVEDGEAYVMNDELKAASNWSDEYESHTYQDYIDEYIRTAITDKDRTTADSIEYYTGTSTDEILTESMGDTLRILAEQLTGTRSFTAGSADDVYTLTADGGVMTDGSYTVAGVRDTKNGKVSTIDADGHSLLEVQGGTLTYKDVNITNTAQTDGAVLNISSADANGTLSGNVNINSEAANGIVNKGTLTITDNSEVNTNTSIIGTGAFSTGNNVTLNLTNGASIIQDTITFGNVVGGAITLDSGDITAKTVTLSGQSQGSGPTLTLGNESILTADLVEILSGTLKINADNLHSKVNIGNTYAALNLGTGALNYDISTCGDGEGSLNIIGDVINNAVLSSNINIKDGGNLTTNADNLLSSSVTTQNNNATLILTGGTVTQSGINAQTNVTGDVNIDANISGKWSIAEGASVSTDNAGFLNWSANMQNSGTINLSGGTMNSRRDIIGGEVNILGDVDMKSYIQSEVLNIVEGAVLKTSVSANAIRAEKIVNDGVISITTDGGTISNQYVKNPITGSGYIEFANGTSYLQAVIAQDIKIRNGATFAVSTGGDIQDDVYVDKGGTLQFESKYTFKQNVTGDGRVSIYSNTTTNEGLIDVAGGIDIKGTLITDADDIGDSAVRTESTGRVTFTGGTITNSVSGNGTTRIQTDSSVISEAIISTTNLQLYDRATLTIDADDIQSTTVTMNTGSNLILGDGTINYDIKGASNDRTVTIAGDVTTLKYINNKVVVNAGGKLTSNISLLKNNVINNGSLYLSGDLKKNIAGNGTTYINGALQLSSSTSSIDGTLNLNNGLLITDRPENPANAVIRTYDVNKATGEGDFSFNVNLKTLKADKINLTDPLSDAIFKVTASELNITATPAPDVLTYYAPIQILAGGTGAQLQIVGDGIFNKAMLKERYDGDIDADVWFDDVYKHIYQTGNVTGKIELAQTESKNDSIQFTDVITNWDSEQSEDGNLLKAWNQYNSGGEEKFFRFRTANDIYKVPSEIGIEHSPEIKDLGYTPSGNLNILGVADDESGAKSTIDMSGASGFNLVNAGTTMNLSNVTIKNTSDFFIKSTNATNSIGTIDEEGRVSGGLENVSFIDNTASFKGTDDSNTSVIHIEKGTISQIINSEFKNNSTILTNTDSLNFTPSARGAAIVVSDGTIGSELTGEGGIINSVFENNTVTLNNSTGQANAAALRLSGANAYIANIKDSVFKNNTSTSIMGSAEGALHLSNSAHIKNIENSKFIGNSATGETNAYGGAIRLTSNCVIDVIKDSLFENNSANTDNSNYRGMGGAIMLELGSLKELRNTTFNNNHASTGGGAISLYDNPSVINIYDSAFNGNTAVIHGGALRVETADVGDITNTEFINNRVLSDTYNQKAYGGAISLSAGKAQSLSGLTFTGNGIQATNSTAGDKHGGALYSTSSIDSITDSTFTGNFIDASANNAIRGGAVYLTGTIGQMSNLTFDGNYIKGGSLSEGAGLHKNGGSIESLTDSVFKGNYIETTSTSVGGAALYITGSAIIDKIDNLVFENNYVKSNNTSILGGGGGIVYANGSISDFTNSRFTGNHAEGKFVYGGTLFFYDSKIDNFEGVTFENNYAKGITNVGGSVLRAEKTSIKNFEDVTFTNNYSEASGESHGGAINFRSAVTIENFENVTFENNYALSKDVARGGALATFSTAKFSNGIVNSSFINNYVDGKSSATHGGAIYYDSSNKLSIIAKDGGESIFKGNYKINNGDESTKEYEAIYIDSYNITLTLDANTGGTIEMHDIIRGDNGTQTAVLTGDSSGTIKIFNQIDNMKVTADKVNIDTSNNAAFDYDFNKLTSAASAKYKIDFDLENSTADNFTVGAGSTGTVVIDGLNVLGTSDENKTIQIIHAKDDALQLALSENINTQTDLVANLGDTVYNNVIYHQNEGFALTTTDTTNDSIKYLIEQTFDGLDLIAKSTLNQVRNFVFDNNSNYITSADISDVAAGTLNITGLNGTESISTIDFNGKKAFNLTNDSALNITDTKLTNAKDNTVINIVNQTAEVNLNNVQIDGNIYANNAQNININGNADFSGTIEGANVNLKAGTLSMAQNTFQNASSLTAEAGTITLANNTTGENYIFSNLNSGADTKYILDINLADATSDTISVGSGSKGVITINDINYFNELGESNDFTLQILKAADDSIQLALADNLKNLSFRDISRIEKDEIQENTSFSHIYYSRERKGSLESNLTLVTKDTLNDSINFKINEVWENTTTILETLGDTLKLVAQAENIDGKTFSSNNASEVYQVTDDIGKIAAGGFEIFGTNSGSNISTINFNKHQGFEVGENSDISIDSTRLTGTDEIIHVTDASGTVHLKDAVIDGNITGDEKFDLTIDGNHNTVINGSVINADATLSKGNLTFAENTFADSNTTLNVTGGSINLNNGSLDNYNINELNTTADASYALDIDLSQQKADTITVGENSSGTIVLSVFNMTGSLEGVDKDDSYIVQIIKSPNSNTQLALSETLASQLEVSDVVLGYEKILLNTDDINAHSKWDDLYNITYQNNEIRGRLELHSLVTKNDSLKLNEITVNLSSEEESQGDTLMLVNQLDKADRSFTTTNAAQTYELSDNIGSTAQGTFSVAGAADDKGNISTIDMNSFTGFVLDNNNTTLNISNVKFQNLNFADGAMINITDKDAAANLNNVTIAASNNLTAINNDGNINMTGGKVVLNSGIKGSGITNITGGADVLLTNNSRIEQADINVENGSLTINDNSYIQSALAIGIDGVVTTAVESISSDVANDGVINFTGGNLAYNITGGGTTNIKGEVVNNALIDNNVDVQSGKLTTSAENITGSVNNEADLVLDGTLEKVITGDGTTTANKNLTLAKGAGIDGTLDMNDASISTNDGQTSDYHIGKMINEGLFSIDIDLSAKTADKFIVGENSQGRLTLDNLNILGSINLDDIPENPEDYKIQILDAPSDAIQLAISKQLEQDLNNTEYLIKTTHVIANPDIKAINNWDDKYFAKDSIVNYYGKLGLTTTNTTNDSIGITNVTFRESEDSVSMGDTLALVNQFKTDEERQFNFDAASNEYDVSDNIGKTAEGSLSVNGVQSGNGERKSTIDFNNYSGFETGSGVELNISNTELKNAQSEQGSVINSTDKDAQITLTNTNLVDNKATGSHGAAIYSASDVTLTADNGNTVIKGNKTANDDEAVYLTGSKLTLNTVNNGKTYINDKINGDNGYSVSITGDTSGDVYLSNQIKNSDVKMDNVTLNLSGNNHFATSNFLIDSGTLNLVNGVVQEQIAKSVTINGSFNLNADVDLKNEIMDRLPENTVIANDDAFINVDKLNLISDTTAQKVEIPFAYAGFKDNVKYVGPEELSKDTQITAFAPIYKYSLEYENRDDLGYFVFTRGGGASPSSPDAFNPAVLASPVAAQAGGFAAMNETFNYAFKHSDYFSMLPSAQRLSAHLADRYAIVGTAGSPVQSAMKDSGIWFQPYANFENIGLSNGPSVDVISYGSLVGGDSEYINLKNGWGTVTTAYVGYNGSYQDFSGVSTNQNGGVLGATQTFYKDNFFTALTASAGASVGDSSTMYGNETFAMLMSGVASKTGYNFEFKNGKYILQPSMLMSYTFVNTFDYTNAAGVGINSDPLHTLQIHPNIKFAANLENGWQPYAFAGMVWNIMNDTKFAANNIVLPSMSIRPYVEYGIGVQRTWKDSLTGYFQTMIRNGGRNGVALSFGFRWALGHNNYNPSKVQTVIKKLPPEQTMALSKQNIK